MNEVEYSAFVLQRTKDPEKVLASLDASKVDWLHAAMGVAGEAGELLDAIKKHAIYGQPLDEANIAEELGDIEFYLQLMRDCLVITREEILQANVEKLRKRYPAGYTDVHAAQRLDKTNGA